MPQASQVRRVARSRERFELLQDLVREVRNARKANNVPPNQGLDARIEAPESELAWLRPAADAQLGASRADAMPAGATLLPPPPRHLRSRHPAHNFSTRPSSLCAQSAPEIPLVGEVV